MTIDDLGTEVRRDSPARRVVSLVPSLTEALATVRIDALVGATDWCTHPADLDVRRVRGTKNPDLRAIIDLAPDLVVCNQEENRELDVQRLRAAGVPVWVTRIRTLEEAFTSMARLFEQGLGWPLPAWLAAARTAWAAPADISGLAVAAAVWRDPWMWVGSDTFASDLLARLGCARPVDALSGRYPTLAPEEIPELGVDVVLLPDEPYVFSASDGPECFPHTPVALVSGRLLTWYGPSLESARQELTRVIQTPHAKVPTPLGEPGPSSDSASVD